MITPAIIFFYYYPFILSHIKNCDNNGKLRSKNGKKLLSLQKIETLKNFYYKKC